MTIKNAAGLPPSLSHFVFCQYMFWGDTDLTVVPPSIQQPIPTTGKSNRNHSSLSSTNQNNNPSSLKHSVSSYDHSFNNPYANLYSSTNSYHQNDNRYSNKRYHNEMPSLNKVLLNYGILYYKEIH